MASRVRLTALPNSHVFLDRECSLETPVKIGRSVARTKPSHDNLIFDCKVLSRNHALLWEEGDKFFIRDMKSSNGTFVNRQRLSRSGEESAPFEIKNGDELQFGVDVVENKKVTHGCVIATVTFLKDDAAYSQFGTVAKLEAVSSRDLIELTDLLQALKQREEALASKLAKMQEVILSVESDASQRFQMLLNEDHLLSRIEVLENQVQIYSQTYETSELQNKAAVLVEEKMQYEVKSKEALRRVLQEKLEYASKLAEIQRNYDQSEEECDKFRAMYEESQESLKNLREAHNKKKEELVDLENRFVSLQAQYVEHKQMTTSEKEGLEKQVKTLTMAESKLAVQVESLQAEFDFAAEHLTSLKAKLETASKKPERSDISIQVEALVSIAECQTNFQTDESSVQTSSLILSESHTQTDFEETAKQDQAVQVTIEKTVPVRPAPKNQRSEVSLQLKPFQEDCVVQKAELQASSLPGAVSELDSDMEKGFLKAENNQLRKQKNKLEAQLYELEKKLNEAEASTQLSSEMSDALEKVWKDLRESKEQNQKLQMTLSQQRSNEETMKNQLHTEHQQTAREKREKDELLRKNTLLSVQLAEIQGHMHKQEAQLQGRAQKSIEEGKLEEKRQKQRDSLQAHLTTMNKSIKEKQGRIEILQNQLRDLKERFRHARVSRRIAVILGIAAAIITWIVLYVLAWVF
ncbi:sarcolemmal membrane-associated protein-like [Oscarella lobularis]|uniref:sarcolemmal membrane-associated protein-like n=1 Tax=Oscarella lobularis TaxID=121494 RepID=UPI00331418E8